MKSFAKILIIALTLCSAVLLVSCQKSEKGNSVQTFQGYITSEDDFADGKGEDTAEMVDMETMAKSGLGITFQGGRKWKFYYFDGWFATENHDGSGKRWEFNGTGAQKQAWRIVEAQVKNGHGSKPVAVTVAGTLTGEKKSNPGSDNDGKSFEVISVKSITVPDAAGKDDGTSKTVPAQSSTLSVSDGMSMDSQVSSEQPMSDSMSK